MKCLASMLSLAESAVASDAVDRGEAGQELHLDPAACGFRVIDCAHFERGDQASAGQGRCFLRHLTICHVLGLCWCSQGFAC